MLPVNFEIYPNYLQQCSQNWEVIIGNPKYRSVLDQKLAQDYFDNPQTVSAAKLSNNNLASNATASKATAIKATASKATVLQ